MAKFDTYFLMDTTDVIEYVQEKGSFANTQLESLIAQSLSS